MGTDRSLVPDGMPAAIVIVALIGAFVTLAIVRPEVAIMVVIFGFIFGSDLLRELTAALRESNDESTADETPLHEDPQDALERLRTRYADGELSDAEFERRLEVLLETESEADVERFLAGETDVDRLTDRDPADPTDRELERSSG